MKIIKDEDYYKLKTQSYSMLSRFDREGPISLVKKFESTPAMLLGSVVDDLLTNSDNFDNLYAVSKEKYPTASLLTLFDAIKGNISSFYKEDKLDVKKVQKVAKKLNLWSSIKNDDVYLKKFNTREFVNFLKEYKNSLGKTVIDLETFRLAKKMVNSLLEDDHIGPLFRGDKGEVINQLSILWANGKYKSRLDLVIIDHDKKKIFPYDLKTIGDTVYNFKTSFMKFRYYIQDAMYHRAVVEWADEKYPDYEVETMQNIVISSSDYSNPTIFKIDENWIHAGTYGFYIGNTFKKGYIELSKEIDWHKENQIFNKSMKHFNDGYVSIEFNGILS